MTRYIIIGSGGVGAALALGLRQAGRDATIVSRGTTLDTIRDRGLRVRHQGTDHVVEAPVVGSPADLELRVDDVLVLAVKSQDAEAAIRAWAQRPVVLDDAGTTVPAAEVLPIVTLQNGLDAPRVATRHFAQVIGGVALIAASHLSAGTIDVRNGPKLGQIILGAYPSAAHDAAVAERVPAIVQDLRAAEWLVQQTDDPRRWLAWKLSVSVTFPAEVLAGAPAERQELQALLSAEARTVLEAAGFSLADPATEITYDRDLARVEIAADAPIQGLSTWQSFTRGSGSEVDFLNGEIAVLARQLGINAPVNTAVQRELAAAAAAGEQPGVRPIDAVRQRSAAASSPSPGTSVEAPTHELAEVPA
ncbi:ketopantoate reductase family protein [Leucobacter japonicus]|uniref:ketopantoate reductase family protein n=1 Tax=Leucobacter japonicus TaxID=1461259 RepID=UPI0006A77339|nr:2-dehydropantoate 2-reductase N-terminal domain-containing protein [Leucobacter japonicus]